LRAAAEGAMNDTNASAITVTAESLGLRPGVDELLAERARVHVCGVCRRPSCEGTHDAPALTPSSPDPTRRLPVLPRHRNRAERRAWESVMRRANRRRA